MPEILLLFSSRVREQHATTYVFWFRKSTLFYKWKVYYKTKISQAKAAGNRYHWGDNVKKLRIMTVLHRSTCNVGAIDVILELSISLQNTGSSQNALLDECLNKFTCVIYNKRDRRLKVKHTHLRPPSLIMILRTRYFVEGQWGGGHRRAPRRGGYKAKILLPRFGWSKESFNLGQFVWITAFFLWKENVEREWFSTLFLVFTCTSLLTAKKLYWNISINKQLLDEVFVISRIIEVEVGVGVISQSRRLRLITLKLTETSIIRDITKNESNNNYCFIIHCTEKN